MIKPVLVKERVERAPNGKEWKHLYACYCGNTFITYRNFVDRGHTKSCGCSHVIHGHTIKSVTKTRTYTSWDNMIQRCTNSNHTRYAYYGGRGITICDSWLSFSNFLEDMGERPEGCSIDRIDNNKGYSKDNCRWADRVTQMANRRPYKKRTKHAV